MLNVNDCGTICLDLFAVLIESYAKRRYTRTDLASCCPDNCHSGPNKCRTDHQCLHCTFSQLLFFNNNIISFSVTNESKTLEFLLYHMCLHLSELTFHILWVFFTWFCIILFIYFFLNYALTCDFINDDVNSKQSFLLLFLVCLCFTTVRVCEYVRRGINLALLEACDVGGGRWDDRNVLD